MSAQILVTGNTLTSAGDILVSDETACVYRSTDRGSTFTGFTSKISSKAGIVFKLLTAPDGVIYAAVKARGVYMSTDNGNTWISMGIDSVGKSILDTGKPNEARAVIQDALAKARVQQKRGHEAELLIILGTHAESTGDGTDAKITGDFL